MSSLNKVQIIGNVGQDPEVRAMPNGELVANLSIATSESWKDKQTGEKKERTEWHRVCLFGKLAEIVHQYVAKGTKLYIEGQLRTRKWQAQDGSDRYSTEVVLSGFNSKLILLGGNQPAAPAQAPQNPESLHQPQQAAITDFDNETLPF